jgi:ATP-dependent protease ClpP protease subunit
MRNWNVALRAQANDTLEIAVFDVIGKGFFGDGVDSKDVLARLRAAPKAKTINLRVNSIGGLVGEAKAMVNLLAERSAAGVEIVAYVDGLAASSAAYLLTAADRVVMPSNTFQMIHGVRGTIRGQAEELAEAALFMQRENEQLAEAFAAASARRGKKKTKEDYLAIFASRKDMYFDADKAIEWGLADEKREAATQIAAILADVSHTEMDGAPGALFKAGFVSISGEPYISPGPSVPGRTQVTGQQEQKNMKTISIAVIAALLGMTAEAAEAAEEKDILDGLKKKLEPQPASIALSGVKLLGVATEAEATQQIHEYQRTELTLLGSTNKPTLAEAMTVVLGWKTKADTADKLTTQVGELTESARIAKRDGAIEKLSREGLLPPAKHAWARQQFATADAVETFCAGMPKGFFASVTEQTDGTVMLTLSDEERQVCKHLNIAEKDYLEQKKLDMQNQRGRAPQVGV